MREVGHPGCRAGTPDQKRMAGARSSVGHCRSPACILNPRGVTVASVTTEEDSDPTIVPVGPGNAAAAEDEEEDE